MLCLNKATLTWLAVNTFALFLLSEAQAQNSAPAFLEEKGEAQINSGLQSPPPAEINRETPRRAWTSLSQACQTKRWEIGAHLLNLGDVPAADQKTMGAILTQQFCELLLKTKQLSAGQLDDSILGPLLDERPRNYAVAATFAGPEGQQEAWLRRFRDDSTKQYLWILSRQSVSQIPIWYRRLVKKEESHRPPVETLRRGLSTPPANLHHRNPRETIFQFLEFARRGKYDQAMFLLDFSSIPEDERAAQGPKLARRLALVLKRLHPGAFANISVAPQGAPEKDVDFDEELLAKGALSGLDAQIILARYPQENQEQVWLFSAATVADIDLYYEKTGYGWMGEYLPAISFEWQFARILLWQWLGLALALLVALPLSYLACFLIQRFLARLTQLTNNDWDNEVVRRIRGPLFFLCFSIIMAILISLLALDAKPSAILFNACKIIGILAVSWFIVRLVDIGAAMLMSVMQKRHDELGRAMIPLATKIVKPIIVIILLIVTLQNMGLDVSGLIAGLGIGGLALALAGKTTVENLLCSLTLAFDRAFKVGDFVKVGDISGNIEDLGLRSTKIRTLSRTLVTVPNNQMADAKIENFSKRDRQRFQLVLNLQYDTSPPQMQFIIDECKRYLLKHQRVLNDFSVRFVGFSNSSLDVEIFGYIDEKDFSLFTGLREEIYFQLRQFVEQSGARFAFPSTTQYFGKDTVADAQKARATAEIVAQRLQEGTLCLPEIPDSVKSLTVTDNIPRH